MKNNLLSILDQTRECIAENSFKRLILAVSGGMDSICLAHFFICNKEALGIEWIGIAHVHHGLRKGTADRDAEFVNKFCNKFNCPFFLKKIDGDLLKSTAGSLEENARKARYEALYSVAQSNTANVIITAHHAGDQAETMYMRLRRGVTLAGLSGIRQIRHGSVCGNRLMPIYRPFINVPRQDLLAYAKENNLEWREDESNTDLRFTRNLVRQLYLPHLEKTCPGAALQLVKIAFLAQSAHKKVISEAEKAFASIVVSNDVLLEKPAEVQGCSKLLVLDTRKNRIVLLNGMDEIFRLWLDSRGFRFPIGTFQGKTLLNEVRNLSYRSRFIVKKSHFIWICDKGSTESV